MIKFSNEAACRVYTEMMMEKYNMKVKLPGPINIKKKLFDPTQSASTPSTVSCTFFNKDSLKRKATPQQESSNDAKFTDQKKLKKD